MCEQVCVVELRRLKERVAFLVGARNLGIALDDGVVAETVQDPLGHFEEARKLNNCSPQKAVGTGGSDDRP